MNNNIRLWELAFKNVFQLTNINQIKIFQSYYILGDQEVIEIVIFGGVLKYVITNSAS